ncbi:MAG: molecular chaperone DnaK [Candidatus Dadabacteria bacterium]|nr:molecular chaperone DnaK [Candidatus Dadabacteria bacterium]
MAIVGIDLGTTNSCVALVEAEGPIVIPNEEGSRTTPSVVAFTEDGSRFAGAVAKRQATVNPLSTISAVKRLIGRRIDTPEVLKAKQMSSYEIVPSESGDAWAKVGDKSLSPEEISGIILTKMKQIAEEFLGYEVNEAVITVPAHFNDRQRQATKDAGKIAGLNVKRIINEPTAAALAYGMDRKANLRVAVFDLGGGTFDISILEMANGVFDVKATSGDTFLGGEDFDLRMVEYVLEEFKKEHDTDLQSDRMALQRIREAVEKAKHELSSVVETNINLPFIAVDSEGPKHLNVTINRAKFEELVNDLIERLQPPCEKVLKDSGVKPEDIDEVILAGGMTRMPRVQEKVKEIFGKEPQKKGINPDEVIAIGAAVQGGVLEGKVDEVLLLDVVPLSLGVEIKGGLFTSLIDRNTTIPTKKSRVFTTAFDNQDFVSVHVLQGEREMAEHNISLAKFELIGLPPAPRGVPQIEVSFDIDADGIVHVSAKDLGTQKEQAIRISPTGGLTEAEIENIIEESEKYHEEDQRRKELAIVKNEAEGIMISVGRTLSAYGDKIDNQTKDSIEQSMEKMKEVLQNSDDCTEIKLTLGKLQESAYKFASTIYSRSGTKEQKSEEGNEVEQKAGQESEQN